MFHSCHFVEEAVCRFLLLATSMVTPIFLLTYNVLFTQKIVTGVPKDVFIAPIAFYKVTSARCLQGHFSSPDPPFMLLVVLTCALSVCVREREW